MRKAVVTVILNSEGKILLLKRPPDHKKFPNEWCLPGGKQDWIDEAPTTFSFSPVDHRPSMVWESPESAAFRETLEETGIIMYNFYSLNTFMADEEYVCYIFHASGTDHEVTKEFPNREHVRYLWVYQHELDVYFEEGTLGKMTYDYLKRLKIIELIKK